jgi:hypothetical protein
VTKRITKQYVESLQKHIKDLEKHSSLLESKLSQLQKEHGLCELESYSRPIMSPVISSDSESDMDEGGWPADSGVVHSSDSEGDADIEQLIAPTKRLVVRCNISKHSSSDALMSFCEKLLDGHLHLYGSFSPFAHYQTHKHTTPSPASPNSENYNSTYVLMVDGTDLNHTNSDFDWARHLPREFLLDRHEHDK